MELSYWLSRWKKGHTGFHMEKMRRTYAKKISDLSSVSTKMLMHLLSYDQSEMTGPLFSMDPEDVKRLFSEKFDIHLLEKNSLDIHKFEKFLNRGLKSDLIEYLLLLSVSKTI